MTKNADVLEADVVVPSDLPPWEERAARLRAEWRKQDQARYVNPDFDPDLDATWNVYMWQGPVLGWDKVGSVRKKRGRRKEISMNRLFANLRQKFGIAAEVPVKLISQQDDETRIRAKQYLAPPRRFETNRPLEPKAESVAIRKFVSWGALAGKWIYLGACVSNTKREAKREIEHKFPAFVNVTVASINDLSYTLRNKIRDGVLVAGVSRSRPPGAPKP